MASSSSSSTLSCISSAISCISTIIDDLESLDFFKKDSARYTQRLEIADLGYLKTFLLCARRWSEQVDASLGALLVRIEDLVFPISQKIHSYRLSDQFARHLYATTCAVSLVSQIEPFYLEIHQWYVVFIDCSQRQSSDSPVNIDELLELFDSLLKSLEGLSYRHRLHVVVVKFNKALVEKLTFMKHLLHFITLHGVEDEALRLFLIMTESTALFLAYRIFKFRLLGEELPMLIERGEVCQPPQTIVPEDICESVIAHNFSRKSRKEVDQPILRGFVDMLLKSLWDGLKYGPIVVIHQGDRCLVVPLRYQLQKLYEGLRSLRIILKIKPEKFDEKMKELTADLVYDAGLTIFSLPLVHSRKDGLVNPFVSDDLLEKFKVIHATVAEEFPERTSFNFPRTNELGFVDFLLNYLMDLTSPVVGSLALVNCQVQTIQEELSFLHSFLGKIVELRHEDEEPQSLWDRVMEVAFKVEFLIDSLLVQDFPDPLSYMSFDMLVEEIKIIKVEVLDFDITRINIRADEVTKTFNPMPAQGSKPMKINNVVVGLEDEARSIINRLTRGSHKMKIVPIVGMPGIGKTTLAEKVYNDRAVINHFHMRVWCTVSHCYQKENLLLEILTSMDSELKEEFLEMKEEDLALQVKRRLLRNKYLIVLDDVWDIEVWNGLEALFPDNGNGSRVLLTSRHCDVASQDKLDKEPHSLRELTPDESWDLLKERICTGKDFLPPELCERRKEIVELCQGLPLAIVILAGILANMDQSGWKEVVQSLSLSNISRSELCTAALELSYKHLTDNLKPCFLYFGVFPESRVHITERLIWLWVAEGFVPTTPQRSPEDVANDYLMNLIRRNLVMVSKERSIGGVKTCRIHDLLHEFCVRKAKEEKFLLSVRGYDELYALYAPQYYIRRLCINSEAQHIEESSLSFPTVRSLLFFELDPRGSWTFFDLFFIFRVFKLLRVLDLSEISLGGNFPGEIKSVIQLRYLAVRGFMESIPSSIANLSHLETLIIMQESGLAISLPESIWNMEKLRHLQIKDKVGIYLGGGIVFQNLDNSSDLCNLNTLSTLRFSSWKNMDKILKKFLNVRKLKCIFWTENYPARVGTGTFFFDPGYWDISAEEGRKMFLVFDFLSQLKSLKLTFRYNLHKQYQFEFHFPSNIEKLTLDGFCLPWSQMLVVANLRNLKVLKLLNDAFVGEEWSIEEEEFSKLEFLQLARSDIVKWTALDCESSFPCLKNLGLGYCKNLVEIPSSLGNVSSLETIELFQCPGCARSVEEIKNEQISNLGYIDLKIISSSWDDGY